MCLLFLRTIRSRLHRIVCGQHRREDLLGSVGGHGGRLTVRTDSGGSGRRSEGVSSGVRFVERSYIGSLCVRRKRVLKLGW
jgi:hypothetical protein